MKQYLLSVYQPDGAPSASIDMDRVMSELEALQDEMRAAGGWVFWGGLHPVSTATVVHLKDGDVLTDGPYVEGKEQRARRRRAAGPARRRADRRLPDLQRGPHRELW
jgi:hypothetical protein